MVTLNTRCHYLGNICLHGHVYEETGQGLRYLKSGDCVVCHLIRGRKKYESARDKLLESLPSCPYPKPDFDSIRYFLGEVCSKKHEFCTGLNLRYVLNRDCVECRREHSKARRKAKKEEIAEYGRQRYQANRESLLEYYRQKYYANPEVFAARKKKYVSENADKVRSARSRYKRSERGREVERKYEHKRRALEKLAHHYPWTAEEIEKRLDEFDNCCAYCGRSDRPLTLDHFLSISSGGADCLGNIVPCCRPCNSSKNNREPKIWFESQSFHSHARWKRILAVLGLSKVDYRQLPLF